MSVSRRESDTRATCASQNDLWACRLISWTVTVIVQLSQLIRPHVGNKKISLILNKQRKSFFYLHQPSLLSSIQQLIQSTEQKTGRLHFCSSRKCIFFSLDEMYSMINIKMWKRVFMLCQILCVGLGSVLVLSSLSLRLNSLPLYGGIWNAHPSLKYRRKQRFAKRNAEISCLTAGALNTSHMGQGGKKMSSWD